MAERRILYLTALIAGLVFFWAYREWTSWIILLVILLLPLLSLLLSLQAMKRMRLHILCPERMQLGQEAQVTLMGDCNLPHPTVRGRLRASNPMTGESLLLRSGEEIPGEHCAAWIFQAEKAKVYDYLGLFSHKIRRSDRALTFVMPQENPMTTPPDLTRYLATAFKPKPGGGYAENHELRLYRPGDNLHQIHWKLTAKTGKLILREPMEPIKGRAVVSMELSGDGAAVDEKLGRLLWVCRYLLENNVPHEIHCLTGNGTKVYSVSDPAQITGAVLDILKQPLAPAQERIDFIAASWKYHIGGDGRAS